MEEKRKMPVASTFGAAGIFNHNILCLRGKTGLLDLLGIHNTFYIKSIHNGKSLKNPTKRLAFRSKEGYIKIPETFLARSYLSQARHILLWGDGV